MKKPLAFLACFTVFISFAFSYEQEDVNSYSYARLSYVKGDVFIQRAEDLGYEEGVINLPVVEGDKLGTREGRAEIHLGKKNYIRINSFSQIDFVSLPRNGYDQIKLHLLSGNIYLRINFIEEEKSIEVHTPDASFYILDEGLYRIEVRENRETELLVYEGAAEAAGEEGSLLVEREEKLIVSNGRFSSDPVYFYPRFEDSFSQWNRDRDALHAKTVTRGYLPSELDEYEVELADNGRWVYERPYGYVWVPHVYHYGWRPYHYGRWIWYPVIGWTWVSHDPWGWCVYHYGRWHWRLGLGWYWIPTRVWGPAWVHWYYGYNYIGWCPLSYYGYPGVVVNNYFYGRYYGRYYPANSRALVVINKNQLRAPRISRVALSQDKVVRLKKISLSAKQPGIKPVIKRASLQNSTARKVLQRSNLREVRRIYGSGKALTRSGLRTLQPKSSSRVLRRTSVAGKSRTLLKKSGKILNSGNSSRSPTRYPSRLSSRGSKTSGHISSSSSVKHRSLSKIKTYPSRRTNPSSRSRAISSSSSRGKKSLSSRSVKAVSGRSSSSRTFSSKKGTSWSERPSRTYKSSSPSLRRSKKSYSAASRRVSIPKASSFVRRSTSRSSSSTSSFRSSRSRSVSSRGSKVSSSRMSSSRSQKSSSSRSRVSRSSSRSSSSRSSSGKVSKKK